MNIYGLEKKKTKVSQHLNKLKDKRVLKNHIGEQQEVILRINQKIMIMRTERKKKNANR